MKYLLLICQIISSLNLELNFIVFLSPSALMYPTPVCSHAGRGSFSDVYEPAEDSFLLIDALEKDADRLKGNK